MFIINKLIDFVITTVLVTAFSVLYMVLSFIPCTFIIYISSFIFRLYDINISIENMFMLELVILASVSLILAFNKIAFMRQIQIKIDEYEDNIDE